MKTYDFGTFAKKLAAPWRGIYQQAQDDWRKDDIPRFVGSVAQYIMLTLFWGCVAGIVIGLLVLAWEFPPALLIYLAIVLFVFAIWRSVDN